jgi:hypothetical protein
MAQKEMHYGDIRATREGRGKTPAGVLAEIDCGFLIKLELVQYGIANTAVILRIRFPAGRLNADGAATKRSRTVGAQTVCGILST